MYDHISTYGTVLNASERPSFFPPHFSVQKEHELGNNEWQRV